MYLIIYWEDKFLTLSIIELLFKFNQFSLCAISNFRLDWS